MYVSLAKISTDTGTRERLVLPRLDSDLSKKKVRQLVQLTMDWRNARSRSARLLRFCSTPGQAKKKPDIKFNIRWKKHLVHHRESARKLMEIKFSSHSTYKDDFEISTASLSRASAAKNIPDYVSIAEGCLPDRAFNSCERFVKLQ